MRFGVRSVMKSIGAPLALLHLAEIYGPWVMTLKVGDYVAGLHPKWKRIRFLDAANMSTGFGGTGTLKTNPNDILDGYLDGGYDSWFTARSISTSWRKSVPTCAIPVGAGNRRALPGSGFLSVGSRHRRLPQIDARSVRRYLEHAHGRGLPADRHSARARSQNPRSAGPGWTGLV